MISYFAILNVFLVKWITGWSLHAQWAFQTIEEFYVPCITQPGCSSLP